MVFIQDKLIIIRDKAWAYLFRKKEFFKEYFQMDINRKDLNQLQKVYIEAPI